MIMRVLPRTTLAVVCAACGGGGEVRIIVDTPADPALDPLDSRVATVTLLVELDGEVRAETVAAGDRDRPIELGDVPIVDGVRLSLQTATGGGRMIGFGRAPDPISVHATDVVEVPIRLRRPFAYVSGASQLRAFDTTLDQGQPYQLALPVAGPAAVASTADGAHVAVLSGDTLSLLETATHASDPVAATAAVQPGGGDLTISRDSRWIGVSHRASNGRGVSIVDLAALRDGAASVTFFDLGGQAGVFLDEERGIAWALIDMSESLFACAEALTQAVPIDLATLEAGAPIPLGRKVFDAAIDPATGDLFVALGCEGRVLRMDLASETPLEEDVLEVAGASTIAVAGGRVWTIGHVDGEGTGHLEIAHAALDGSGVTRLALPVAEERARADEFSEESQSAEVRIKADLVAAYDLAVLPDSSRIAVLVLSTYDSDPTGDFFGSPIIPGLQMVTTEYQLLDAATGTAFQRLRTHCSLTVLDPDAFLTDFSCTSTPGQDQSAEDFIAGNVAVLYGDR
jgi:hypothetical protein